MLYIRRTAGASDAASVVPLDEMIFVPGDAASSPFTLTLTGVAGGNYTLDRGWAPMDRPLKRVTDTLAVGDSVELKVTGIVGSASFSGSTRVRVVGK